MVADLGSKFCLLHYKWYKLLIVKIEFKALVAAKVVLKHSCLGLAVP